VIWPVYVSLTQGVSLSVACDFGFPLEEIMVRRQLLSKLPQLFGLGLFGLHSANAQVAGAHKPLKIMMKSAWGSDDPTRASFPFAHGLALSDAGHEVQIFLTGEATYLMRKATAAAIFPVGWPPLSEMLAKSSPNTFQSFLEGLVPGPVGSRKQT
jgi:hypothetical protein